MSSKYLACTLVLALVIFANSDFEKDKEECANQVVGLATCLPYVGGDAKAPTSDCCTGIKQVLKTSKKCLCVLVKDRNDPDLGLKINSSLALGLPTLCNSPTNVSECPAILHLAPNSTDAKVFEDFENSGKGSNSTPATTTNGNGSNADIKSGGGRGKRWLVVEMGCLLIFSMVLHSLITISL